MKRWHLFLLWALAALSVALLLALIFWSQNETETPTVHVVGHEAMAPFVEGNLLLRLVENLPTATTPASVDEEDSDDGKRIVERQTHRLPTNGPTFRIAVDKYVENYPASDLGFWRIEERDIANAIAQGLEILKAKNGTYAFSRASFDMVLQGWERRYNHSASEGRWDFIQGVAIPGTHGSRVNAPRIKRELFAHITGASSPDSTIDYALPIERIESLATPERLPKDMKMSHLLARYTTRFAKKKGRTINVRLASKALDGILLMPGATVSYNEMVGERSEARGYQNAPVIVQGQIVEGMGGGACQVSSTLYAAALFGGLEIVERHNHSLPSHYIAMGFDAVVSYPLLDLVLKNRYDFPIALKLEIKDNLLTAKIFGTQPRPERIIVRVETAAVIPFKEEITVDPNLAADEIRIRKKGHLGYRLERGRIRWQGDKESYDTFYDDNYNPQTQHVSIGTEAVYPPVDE